MSVNRQRQQNAAYRRDPLWRAAMIHRLSGVLLVCFLPLHFLVLGLAIEGEAHLDSFLGWTKRPLVKLAESGLVFLLVVHMAGGVRVLAVELLQWRSGQVWMAVAAVVSAATVSLLFLVLH